MATPKKKHDTFGEEMDAFMAWASEWNAMATAPQLFKNGKVKPKKKKPVDALAFVRTPGKENLVWDEEAKQRAIQKLIEEEERRLATGEGDDD